MSLNSPTNPSMRSSPISTAHTSRMVVKTTRPTYRSWILGNGFIDAPSSRPRQLRPAHAAVEEVQPQGDHQQRHDQPPQAQIGGNLALLEPLGPHQHEIHADHVTEEPGHHPAIAGLAGHAAR